GRVGTDFAKRVIPEVEQTEKTFDELLRDGSDEAEGIGPAAADQIDAAGPNLTDGNQEVVLIKNEQRTGVGRTRYDGRNENEVIPELGSSQCDELGRCTFMETGTGIQMKDARPQAQLGMALPDDKDVARLAVYGRRGEDGLIDFSPPALAAVRFDGD